MGDRQLGLFEPADLPPAIEPFVTEEDRAVAGVVPRWLRFGTSSWSFPGWKDIVYRGAHTEEALAKEGLGAVARHPLFRTVGLDRSYYGPLRDEDLAAYAGQLAGAARSAPALPRFRVVSKVWDEITTAVFPKHPRYGARAGSGNPSFLDVERFVSEVYAPYARTFADHAGPFVFELTPMPRNTLRIEDLTARIDAFVERLPRGPRWAFELRNEELFDERWLDCLRANGAAHVFTYWTAMPSLRAQLAASPKAIGTKHVVVRLMLPPFMRYAAKKAEYAPFDELVAPQEEMRDDVMDILRAAAAADVEDAFVLVNNKAEGSSPLTVRALAKRAARELR